MPVRRRARVRQETHTERRGIDDTDALLAQPWDQMLERRVIQGRVAVGENDVDRARCMIENVREDLEWQTRDACVSATQGRSERS